MSAAVAIATHVCAQCGAEFVPSRPDKNPGIYCSIACRDAANRERFWHPKAVATHRGETAAILPSESKPTRTSKMTDDEMHADLRRIRRALDDRAHIAGDRHWRLEQIAGQRLNGWTVYQIAVYHGVSREVVKEILGE